MSPSSFDALFDPRSVAVIGASRDPSKVGGSVLANLRAAGFAGRVVPVNARADTVQGLAAAPSLLAVDASVDLAVIAVPAPSVLPALKECVAKAVPVAVVISAGFRESGEEGRRREAELRSWLRANPIRVLGPNCLGWIRPARQLNVTFAPGMPERGNIAFVSHSGALAVAILDWARDRRMGFSLFASLGNQADIAESDVLGAVARDEETRVIAGYIEGVGDGRRFLESLREAAAVKPVVLLKAGRSPEGSRAVSSHTGALAGSDRAFDAALKQAGAVRVNTVEELFDMARALATQPLPRGSRLLVVTNGGGLGIIAADAAHEAGLVVGPLDDQAQARLAAAMPPTASTANPVDLVGDADAARYGSALHVIGTGAADAALVVLTAQAATDAVGVARAVIGATRGWHIPLAAAFVGGARVAAGARALEDAGIPCYPFPEPAVKTLAGMALLATRRSTRSTAAPPAAPPEDVSERVAQWRAAGLKRLGMPELAPLLEGWAIPCVRGRVAATAEEAGDVAEHLGFPVALKIASPDISHKTEIGGVELGLWSVAEVVEAARALLTRVRAARPAARLAGVLVQRMAGEGKELLLGMVRDPQFGALVMVGFGGVYVEVLKDTSVRLAPIGLGDAAEMLSELKMAPLLHGVRGEGAVDTASLSAVICRFAQLAAAAPELAEIEINPLVAGPRGAVAVDARAAI